MEENKGYSSYSSYLPSSLSHSSIVVGELAGWKKKYNTSTNETQILEEEESSVSIKRQIMALLLAH